MGPVGALGEALDRRLGEIGGEADGIGLRLADAGDFAALDRLNAEIVGECGGEHMFGRMTTGFFERIVRNGGAIVLLAEGDGIEGFSTAVPTGPEVPAFHERADRTGLIFGTALRRAVRGRGWHRRLTAARAAALGDVGCELVQAVVSPLNHRSLATLVRGSFAAVAFTTAVHGNFRFVVERRVAPAPMPAPDEWLPLPPQGALEPHVERLGAGWSGTAVAGDGVALSLGYCPPRTHGGT